MNTVTTPGNPVRMAAVLVLLCLVAASAAAQGVPAPGGGGANIRVAIVLGNAPRATDEPTTAQTARCLKAFELYRSGKVNKLLVTGGFTLGYISEARMMKIALVTWGVPPEDIIEDQMSATTVENALFAARIFEQQGWQKGGMLVSQAFHLPRAGGLFSASGFQLQDVAAADAIQPGDLDALPDAKPVEAMKAETCDMIVVHEPFRSLEPMDWPTPPLAHRLRVAAAMYHRKVAPTLVLFNEPYTRSAVNLSQMMKIALVSLGVAPSSLHVVGRGEHRRLAGLAAAFGGKSALVLTSDAAKVPLRAPVPPVVPGSESAKGRQLPQAPPGDRGVAASDLAGPLGANPPRNWKMVFID